MLSINPELKMICVDPWQVQPGNDRLFGGVDYADWRHEENYQNFKTSAEKVYPGRVTIHRMFSLEAAPLVEDESLDFVFIDACHSYEACKADIEAWSPKVRKNGLIAGHDYDWPTVADAVRDTGGCEGVAADQVWIKFKN